MPFSLPGDSSARPCTRRRSDMHARQHRADRFLPRSSLFRLSRDKEVAAGGAPAATALFYASETCYVHHSIQCDWSSIRAL
jgi:hypothetical protein